VGKLCIGLSHETYSGDMVGKTAMDLWDLEKIFCGQKGTGVILRLRLNEGYV